MLPLITPDGSKVLYNRDESEFLIDLTTRDTRQVPGTSPNCYHVSRDGRMLLCPASWDPPVSTVLLDAETGSKTEFLGDPRYNLYDTYFSPDERWVTFTSVVIATGFTQLFIVPYAPGAKPGHDAWIPVTDGQQFDDIPRWSPDGNLVYFTSERDGFRCIWAQRLDPVSKRPQGEAFPVHHLHSARLSLMNVSLGDAGICIARDRLVLTLGEMTGNIWAADLREER